MKPATVIEKYNLQKQDGEKGQILRELNALLLTTLCTRKNARSYVERAISYIEKH